MDDSTPTEALDELTMLKDRARTMGIAIRGNIGIDALKQKIEAKLAGASDEPEEVPAEPKALTKDQKEQILRTELQRTQLALVRCRIYNLNPSKRDLRGEIICIGNRFIGTVRKFIPFGEATDNGYHIPMIIYNDLKTRKFQQIRTLRKNGQIEIDTRMVPEYNIEILPQLTQLDLDALALKQAAAERLG